MQTTSVKDTGNPGIFLIIVSIILMAAGAHFADANELTPKANYALVPLLGSLVTGIPGLYLWVRYTVIPTRNRN